MSTYAWVLLISAALPFLFSFHPRIRFHRRWPAFAIGVSGMMAVFIPWDAAFVHAGIWGFDPEHVWPVRVLGLPLEEWLFFLCIPYCCLFTYHCFDVFKVRPPVIGNARMINGALVTGLLVLAAWNHERAYTTTASALAALWLGFTCFIQRAPWLGRFHLTGLVLLAPFLLVNGVLTGIGLDQPVVWYNDAQNLGLRMGTIPVEDIAYGWGMFGLATSIYERALSVGAQQPIVHAR